MVAMTRARKHLVCLSDTLYYHVTSRCVRRAFLCGVDAYSGRCYAHRRDWIEERLRILSSLFSIELCAYAVMSNHYHLIVKLNPCAADAWSNDEVLRRWTSLFRGPLLVQRAVNGEPLLNVEADTVAACAAVYRQRLKSLSWFMKCLNEPIARRANAEDGCRGHFWEARFFSEALTDEASLLRAMVYVDLNPVRAGIARTPESSDYTSIRARLGPKPVNKRLRLAIQRQLESGELKHFGHAPKPLMPFSDQTTDEDGLPMAFTDYCQLIDATARVQRSGHSGFLDPALPLIEERLGLSGQQWIEASSQARWPSLHAKKDKKEGA